jgi:uncharacterized protein (TIGR03492 family)
MRVLTLVSNGHGEDLIGARLAAALQREAPGLKLQAFPLVGLGQAYAEAGLPLLGPRRVMPSGGLTLHSLPLLLADLKAGLPGLTLQQLRELRRLRTDGLLVIGDAYAQLLAGLVTARWRFTVQTLVSARHRGAGLPPPNRLFMERITAAERWLMRRADAVYVRDQATAQQLAAAGTANARYLGNPVVDGLAAEVLPGFPARQELVLLLPGSRAYAARALEVMLGAAALRPDLRFAVAWAAPLQPDVAGWEFRPAERTASAPHLLGSLHGAGQQIPVCTGSFAQLLGSAAVALGTAGTAHEQSAARGVPVVSFPLPPHYSVAFLRNQQRLLGRALTVTEARPQQLAAELDRLLAPGTRRDSAVAEGRERMGEPGGSLAIARDIIRTREASLRAVR